MAKTVVIASNNQHKVSEIKNTLNFDGWEFKTLREVGVESDPVEDGLTFLDNARIKARAAKEQLGSDVAVLADDSGLMVDALKGAPGVFSSRYSGEEGNDAANNAKLLRELEGVPAQEKTARFVCTLVFIDEDGSEVVSEGTIEGLIGTSERGSEGFGYDPLFFPLAYDGEKTLAEVSQDQKNAISHRGNALRVLRKKLENIA